DWARELDGAAAVINLAGRSINCRYTPENQREILGSRVDATRAVGEAIARAAQPPPVWLNASAAALYKHSDAPMDESGESAATPEIGDAFSIEVVRAWEAAQQQAPTPATRKVALRITLVFGAEGGAYPVFRRLARLGLGGRAGSGRQWVSWIHIADFVRAVEWLIQRADLSGPVNITSPNPVTNAEMMRLFRELCGVPFGPPAAEWMVRLGARIMGTEPELILKSRRILPAKLLASGFRFEFPELRAALEDLANIARLSAGRR
ncbi:MAG: TIGR01777 family oxidoreductase, partial [Verrucomicrobiae bacterium]|nr:TIGR01777 family oxidoreductase [Verrucomicrobiae bacterium]